VTVGSGINAPTVTVAAFAFTVLVPVTDSSKVYVAGLVAEFLGTEMESVTGPLVHGTVAGSPMMLSGEEKTQLVALATWADSATEPPAEPSLGGVAVNDVTVGGGMAATDSLTFAVTVLVPATEISKV
jgi:hypothetical protein